MSDVDEAVNAMLCDDSGSEWEKDVCTDSETSFNSNSIEHKPTKEGAPSKAPLPSKEHLDNLKNYFGHSSFRPMQWKIIHSIIERKEDNCVVMATGYGKSLCYQYPAVFLNGTTVVISPLISLMQDQVLSLEVANISSCFLGTAQFDKAKVMTELMKGKYRIVYVTPEYITGSYGEDLLNNMLQNRVNLTLVAIDEAHCVSQWGHDFRSSYRKLGRVRDRLSQVPFLAVTATATPEVRKDIVKSLNLRKPNIICTGFDRPNLYLKVFPKGNSVIEDLRPYMVKEDGQWTFKGPTIIYCPTKKKTSEVADSLKGFGVVCDAYHAGLKNEIRKSVHEEFVKDKIKVIVATVAFGMGIDKPDVRYIIHYGAPKDIESYYQEIGRAGRDGLPASCLLFYASADFILNRHFSSTILSAQFRKHKEEMSQLIESYLETTECRRKLLLSHFSRDEAENFGDGALSSTCCDNCTRKLAMKNAGIKEKDAIGVDSLGRYDFTEDAKLIIGAVDALGGYYGFGIPIMFLRGSKSDKLKDHHVNNPLYGKGKDKSDEYWKILGRLLLREGYIEENSKNSFRNFEKKRFPMVTVSVSAKGSDFLNSWNRNAKLNQEKPKILLIPSSKMVGLLSKKNREISRFSGGAHMLLPSLPSDILFSSSNHGSLNTSESRSDLSVQHKLYAELIKLRNALAVVNDCMPYMVAPDASLLGMAKLRPSSLENLKKVDGLNEAKIQKFGNAFVEKLVKFCEQNSLQLDCQEGESSVSFDQPRGEVSIGDNELMSCLTDTVRSTYIAYQLQKRDLKDVERLRGLKESTLISHLADAIAAGLHVDLYRLGFTYNTFRTIENFVISKSLIICDLKNVMAVRKVCPDKISWNEVKLASGILILKGKMPNSPAFWEKLKTLFQDARMEAELPSTSESIVNSQCQKGSPDLKQRLSHFQMKKIRKETNMKYEGSEMEEKIDINCDSPETTGKVSSPRSSFSFKRPLFLSSPNSSKVDYLEQNEAQITKLGGKYGNEIESVAQKPQKMDLPFSEESGKRRDVNNSSVDISFESIMKESIKSNLLLKKTYPEETLPSEMGAGSKRKESKWLEAKKGVKKRKNKLTNL